MLIKKENESFVDIQIPLVPEENIQVISLKTMKYNQCIKNSQFFFVNWKKYSKMKNWWV